MVSIKDTNYAIPSGAYFVSPTGNDANPGKQSSPWRTIGKAMSTAPNGATVVIRGGTYREGHHSLNKKLTLQPYPHEQVWVKGSLVVTGWVADGAMWRKDDWTYEYTIMPPSHPEIDDSYPQAGHLEMVFVNGQSLAQVLGKGEVGPGKFYLDRASNQLYIGTNPSGKTVESAVLGKFMNVNDIAQGTAIKGIGFSHYGDRSIHINASKVLVENSTFAWSGFNGLNCTGTDAYIKGNTFTYNGNKGLDASQAHRTIVENNVFSYNNVENFIVGYGVSGAKFTRGTDLVFRDNIFEHNKGSGLWLDINCTNATIVRNIARYNKADGIFFEICHKAIIASNLCHNNGDAGIKVHNSTSAQVFNNTLARNAVNLSVGDTTRVNTNSTEYKAGLTWQTANIVLKNNILSNTDGAVPGLGPLLVNIYSDVDIPGRKVVTEMNNNGYYRTSGSSPETAVRYKPVPSAQTIRFDTAAEFSAKTGFEKNALAIDNVATHPFFIDGANGNFRLQSGSPAIGSGAPLPTHIASAMGVQAGVKVNLGALDPAGPSAGALR